MWVCVYVYMYMCICKYICNSKNIFMKLDTIDITTI